MTPIFATRLSIVADKKHEPDDLFPAAVSLSKQWLQEKADELNISLEGLGDTIDESVTSGIARIGHIYWYQLQDDDEIGWQATLTQPLESNADPSGRFLLRIELSIRTSGNELSITIRGLLSSRFDRIRPPEFVMRPPRIISMLVDTFDNIAANSTKVTYKPKFLLESEVDELIDHILDYNRMAPVVVVSKTFDGKVLCDPNRIARSLMGLARVYVLPSVEAGYELTRRFTKDLSVYHGAVRLYWPEFGVNNNNYAHPLWLGSDLTRPGASARLEEDIALRVTSASAIGVDADRRLLDMEQSRLSRRTEEAQARLRRAQERTRELESSASTQDERIKSLRDEIAETYALIQLAEEERDLAYQMVEAAEERADKLIQEGFDKDARITSLIAQSSPTESIDILPLIQEYEAASTFGDYLALARKIAPERAIVFLDSCNSSAAKSPMTGNLKGCWKALSAVIQGAIEFHDDNSAQLQSTMMDRVGLTVQQFKADTSDSARGQYSGDYTIRYQDSRGNLVTNQLGPHISLGKGNKDGSPFVYWYVDTETRQFIVGHVGAKLRDGTGGYAR